MEHPSLIGQNIDLLMRQMDISDEQLASMLGYSEMDIHRIKEGVLLLSGSELLSFAQAFNIEPEELAKKRAESEYRELLHCMGNYHSAVNKDRIFDYIDTYIEIEEARALVE